MVFTSMMIGSAALLTVLGSQGAEDVSRSEMLAKAADRFEEMDRNGDGYLDDDDFRTSSDRFEALDSDRSGGISKDELKEAAAEKRNDRVRRQQSRMDERFDRLDKDGNGELSKSEFEQISMRAQGAARRGGMGRVPQADANGDGRISRAEHQAAAEKKFDSLDANNDGVLTSEERRDARPQRGGRR